MAVIFTKYQVCVEISSNGDKIGYITDKEKFKQDVDDIINKEEDNKLYTTIGKVPEYKLTLLDKSTEINDEEVLSKIAESAETTYKFYAVTLDGKEKSKVKDLKEAEDLVKKLSEKYEDTLDTDIAIVEVIKVDDKKDIVSIETAKKDITEELDKQVEKIEEERQRQYEEEMRLAALERVESLNGVVLSVTPVSGVITSRFGNMESIRSSGHTGLDIAAPQGTDIKAAAGGTVTFAGYSGGYGNLVKVSHGSGITTYYGHCSAIYVTEGQKVSAGDVIAAVGATGNATGNHLHFEVVKNGVELNPENYLY